MKGRRARTKGQRKGTRGLLSPWPDPSPLDHGFEDDGASPLSHSCGARAQRAATYQRPDSRSVTERSKSGPRPCRCSRVGPLPLSRRPSRVRVSCETPEVRAPLETYKLGHFHGANVQRPTSTFGWYFVWFVTGILVSVGGSYGWLSMLFSAVYFYINNVNRTRS